MAVSNISTNAASSSSAPRLDPKYFQSNSPVQVGTLSTSLDIVPTKPQLVTKANLAGSNNAIAQPRINKPLTPQNSQPHTQTAQSQATGTLIPAAKSTPSLASAYFPTN
jgi:hypothetical protein